jgi:glycosyltransferase involved in cell wall biosynthesis
MKIGVVSAHYMPEVGYQEVHLAKAYARLGYEVKVFTSTAAVALGGDINATMYKKGISKDKKLGFEILRLSSLSYKSKVIPFGLKKAVQDFDPDILVIMGVAKIFPSSLFSSGINKKCRIVSVYGDADEYFDRATLKQKLGTFIHEAGFKLIKQPLYKKAIKYGDRLIMNIPETNDFFLKFLSTKEKKEFEEKRLMLNLGFDPDEYYYSEEERNLTRKKLKVSEDETLIITSTRVNKRKNLEAVIKQISAIREGGKKVCYIIVGFLNDEYEKELKAFIQSQPHPEIFKCFPFLKSNEIKNLYCAADAGIWLKVAISIQEAMGTGLPVILENKPSVNHLIEENVNGWFFEKSTFNNVIQRITTILSVKKSDRKALQLKNAAKLSYDEIALRIIENLPERKQ